MERGKRRCKILKDIRRQIAEANDIAFITSECKHKGDCAGTCPKCEAEVRYLEEQLERRRSLGQITRLAGIAAGIGALVAACRYHIVGKGFQVPCLQLWSEQYELQY